MQTSDKRLTTEAALNDGLAGKAASIHTHAISDVTDLQTSLDAKVDTTTNQSIGGEKTFTGAVIKATGRLGVAAEVYGPSRLGDSAFQTASVDTQSLNIKDNAQGSLAALFATPGDGYSVTSLKSFVANDHIFRIVAKNRDLATADGAAVISVVNEGPNGEVDSEGMDIFAQRYISSGTDVAQTAGTVMLAEGTGQKLDYGFWYKANGASTYSRVYNIDKDTYQVTFDQPVNGTAATSDGQFTTRGQMNTALAAKEPTSWDGTQAEYDAIVTKDANVTYYITG